MVKSSTLLFCLLAGLTLALLAGGCGKKMAPIPPDSLVPGGVRNLTLQQDGPGLSLEWLLPRENIERQPLTDIQGFLIRRHQEKLPSSSGCPPLLHPLTKIDLAYPLAGEIQGELIRFRDTPLEPGYRYYYQVIGYDRKDHLGLPSAVVSQVWDTLPRPPETLQARAGDRQVLLTWPPVTLLADGRPLPGRVTYNIYREGQGKSFARVNTAPILEANFLDIAVLNDVSYRYLIRAVRQIGPDFLESLDSPLQSARPEKLTPPAPVLALAAASTAQGIELHWQAGREPDLAGYRVFRRSLAEPQFRLLTPQLVKPAFFVDQQTSRGVTYYYYVVAVDNSPRANQSLPSEPVEIIR